MTSMVFPGPFAEYITKLVWQECSIMTGISGTDAYAPDRQFEQFLW